MARFRPKDEPEIGPSAEETASFIEKLARIEEIGEEIITDRYQLIDLDKKKNGNREAIRSLKKKKDIAEKSWLCIGNTFFKLEDTKIDRILQQDQSHLTEEIEKIRSNLKTKVSRLHELEGLPDTDRFSLASLSSEDRKYVKL